MKQKSIQRFASGLLGFSLVVGGTFYGTTAAQAATPVPPTLTCPAGSTLYGPATPVRMASLTTNPLTGENLQIPVNLSLTAGQRLNIVSYLSWDGYENRSATVNQPNEQWAVRVGGAVSSLTADLADGVEFAQQTGTLTSVTALTNGVVEIVHMSVLGPTVGIYNSVFPIGFCANVSTPYDLALTKSLTTAGPFQTGSSATL